MFFERKIKRLSVFAHVSINNNLLSNAILKDLNASGCRLESSLPMNITEGQICVITIYPDETLNIGEFDIVTKVHWISEGLTFEAGFHIVEKPEGAALDRFTAYLEYYSTAS